MKISIAHYSTTPVVGGVERVIHAHALAFVENGHSVKIIAGEGGQFDSRIPVHIIPQMRALYQVDEKIHAELLSGKTSSKFEELKNNIFQQIKPLVENSDICIIHNIMTMHFNLALTAAFSRLINTLGGERFISWVHDATFSDSDYRDAWKKDYPWNLLKAAAENVKYVAISQYRRKKTASVLNIPQSAIAVVPDGIDPVSFLKIKPSTHYLFNKLNLYSSDFIFLYPTRIVKRKHIEHAIKIASSMNKKGKNTCLLVTSQPDPYNKGSMLYFKKLKKLAAESGVKNKVIFISEAKDENGGQFNVDEDVLRDLYLLSDLLLFTSKSEGFGIPIIEAGICRLPIACSDIPPLRELGGNEVIYLNKDEPVDKTADRISCYLENTLPVPMFRKVFREYTWDAVFKKKIIPLLIKSTR
jgi:mannosylglucosylglycerate synthase